MDELCNHYLYAGLTCIIIFIYRIRVYWRKQLDGLGQRSWITHAIHVSRTRHTKYYKGKTFIFLLRIWFRTLNWRWQWLRFLWPKLTTSYVAFNSTSMTVHWHVSVDKTCKRVSLKWSTNRLIVILFRICSERDQVLDAVSEKGKCILHIVRGHCRHNLNKSVYYFWCYTQV